MSLMGHFGSILSDPSRQTSEGKQEIRAGYGDAEQHLLPWEEFGKQYGLEGIKQLQDHPESIKDLPYYKFTMDQGLDALTRKASASGFRGSGNELYEMTKYASGLASQTYGDEWQRRMGLAGLGYQASSDLAGLYAGSGRDAGGITAQEGFNERGYIHQVGMSFLNKMGGSSGGGGGGGGGGMCWVADELYGKDSAKTHIVRAYANAHVNDETSLGQFLRIYSEKGQQWAEQIKTDLEARALAETLWGSMYNEALKQ